MKRLSLLLCAVCVCSVLLSVFSVTANAEEITGYEIRQDVYLIDKYDRIHFEYFERFTPNDNKPTTYEIAYDGLTVSEIKTYQLYHRTVYNIFAPKDGYPFVLNKANRVSLENFYYRYLVSDQYLHYVSQYDDVYVIITYVDNTTERIEVEVAADTDNGLDISFDITPSQNVSRFDLYVDSNAYEHINMPDWEECPEITSYIGEIKGDNKYNFNIEIQSEEAGLLSGILGWIQNIFNKIGDTFEKVSNIFTEITQLPSKIWSFISNGLKELFIPSEQHITKMKDDFDSLLENKFGALYQVTNTVIESWDRIQVSDATNTIEFPTTTINLPEGNTFSFGGYNVQIVPDGFTIVADAVKTAVGIACTIAFINGLRKRYEEIMGG